MREIRNVLLFVVVGSLTIFAVENGSTFVLPLVFLGMRSLLLPLSVWVLGAFFAGAITAFLIASLFELSNSLIAEESVSNRRDSSRQREIPPRQSRRTDTVLQDNYGGSQRVYSETIRGARADDFEETTRRRSSEETRASYAESSGGAEDAGGKKNYSAPDIDDDEFYEDWEEESTENREGENNNYEVSQEPKSRSWTGSVYSYTYRESGESEPPKNESIVEKKTEPVTDADYRVIIPPPVSNTPPPVEDDWGKKKKPKSDDW